MWRDSSKRSRNEPAKMQARACFMPNRKNSPRNPAIAQHSASAALYRHAHLLQELLAFLLQQIGEIRQRLAGGQRLGECGQPAWEGIEAGETIRADCFQACVAAALFGVLPEGFALAGQCQVVG